MGKSSAPPAPDYAAAAVAQGQENRAVSRFNAGANRVNQYTPQGSSTWTIRPGADLDNPQPGDYIQTTTLSPEQQAIYAQTAAIDQSLLNTAASQLARVQQTFDSPIDLSGLPAWRTSGQTGAQPAANATSPRINTQPAVAATSGMSAIPTSAQSSQGLAQVLAALANAVPASAAANNSQAVFGPSFGPGMPAAAAGAESDAAQKVLAAMMAQRGART